MELLKKAGLLFWLSIRSHKGKQLLIQKGTEWSIVPFDDIVYCEIINRKVYLHLKDELVLDYYDKIETLERKLDERFFKCHRSLRGKTRHRRQVQVLFSFFKC